MQRGVAPVPDEAGPDAPVVAPAATAEELAAERALLERHAAAVAARELELAQREAELQVEHERMAHALARALLQAAADAGVPPPLDELAVARSRRRRY